MKCKNEKRLPDPQIIRGGVSAGTYSTIADAINAAESGDTIMLEKGATFYEHDLPTISINLNFNVFDNGQATIDAQMKGSIFHITGEVTVKLQNLIIQNGNYSDGSELGSAIYADFHTILKINNCSFKDNYNGGVGSTIYNVGDMTVNNCTFTGNTGNEDCDAGAIMNGGTLTVTGSTFTGNTAPWGAGAIYNDGKMTVTGSTFIDNAVTEDGAQGGAITNDGSATINFNRIVGNISWKGIIWNTGKKIDATLNWWGSNNPDFSSLITGDVDTDSWIVLTIGLSNSKLRPIWWPKNESYYGVGFEVDLLHINTPGAPELNPANGVVPYTGSANFLVNDDPVPNINFSNGWAAWGINEPGLSNKPIELVVSANVDNQTKSITWRGYL